MILGFRGSPDQALAMMRGEVNAIGGMSWEAIQTNHQEWLTEKKIRVLYTQGAQRIKDLPDVPGLLDFATDDRSRNILALLGSGPDIGRSIVAEPGIPADRAAALRKAFMETMEDPEFVAEMTQAQPRYRAAERRRGAAHRGGLGGDAEGTGRAGQALYRRAIDAK